MVVRPKLRPLRVLLTEGTSTSAREAVTLLGLAGHHVEICDPGAQGLARFSRFVRAWHRCPALGGDPLGFLAFVERLLDRDFDVLLPIHEQGMVLAKFQPRVRRRVGLALPSFAAYRQAHDKAGFSRLLSGLGLPQPATRIAASMDELRHAARAPCVIKTAVGTASRGVWMVRDAEALDAVLNDLSRAAWPGDCLVQELIDGATEKAQAVFCRGRLVGFHAYRQLREGAGGGDAIKRSVRRDRVRSDLAAMGEALAWHGALSIDYLMPEDGSGPFYIDGNPRLVEPMAAYRAGVDLVDLLLRVSLGEVPEPLPETTPDVVTHQTMQVLLGSALRAGTRRELICLCRDMALHRGAFAGSREELTPLRDDWVSAVPLAITMLILLAHPRAAGRLVRRGWGAHLLNPASIDIIEMAAE